MGSVSSLISGTSSRTGLIPDGTLRPYRELLHYQSGQVPDPPSEAGEAKTPGFPRRARRQSQQDLAGLAGLAGEKLREIEAKSVDD